MVDGQKFFDQQFKNNLRTYDNIRHIASGQGDDYTNGCLLDYNYFSTYYKLIVLALDLRKQQALDAGLKTIHQTNFAGSLNRGEVLNDNTTMFFIFDKANKRTF